MLAAFLFTNDDVFKPISALSGGERGRVALAKIMLSKANFLILDEPTNHLDILSKEILESAISNYEGTVLYVSHDRYFINQTASKVIEMNQTGAKEFLGDYDYYVEKKKELLTTPVPKVTVKTAVATAPAAPSNKDDWQKQKEEQTRIRRIQNQITKVETTIQEAEAEMEDIDAQLCLEEVYTNAEKSKELLQRKSDLEAQVAKLYEDWESLSEAL